MILEGESQTLNNPNGSYIKFIESITQFYDDCFPKTKFKIKSNNKAIPWIRKGIEKSSKHKQKLYEKFLKNPTPFRMKKDIWITENVLKQ